MTETAWVRVQNEVGRPKGAAIHYSLIADALVTLEIFDVLGVKVRTLVAGETQKPGAYEVFWDGRDHGGHAVHNGNYLYRLTADALQKGWRFDFSKPFALGHQNP